MAHIAQMIETDILGYLQQQEKKTILRLLTCGNVDDGKSTLIGRLLHDSKLIFDDQLAAIKRDSQKGNRAEHPLDLALLVDGLQAEREQGITIDVAYRYFSTDKRKFVIADCPGHEEYTRNMATGASHCELAIILIDARKGVQLQTKRHSCIVSLLGIKQLIVAVNKMDLVDYSQTVFDTIAAQYRQLAQQLNITTVHFMPISALKGDNIVVPSTHMPWFTSATTQSNDILPSSEPSNASSHYPTLMQALENIPLASQREGLWPSQDQQHEMPFRFPVQWVNRAEADFRGFCGTIASGTIRPGDTVTVLPSGCQSRVSAIVTADGNLSKAITGQAITLTLEDELDISRGDMLINNQHAASTDAVKVTDTVTANLIWMSATALIIGQPYLFKLGGQTISGQISNIHHRLDINSLTPHPAKMLQLNEVASVTVTLHQQGIMTTYQQCRTTGGFIMIDRVTNATVAAGMIESLPDIQVATAADNIAAMSYPERLAAFNAEVSLLVQKYFPDKQN